MRPSAAARGSLLEARLSSLCDAGPRAWEEAGHPKPGQVPHLWVSREELPGPWPLGTGWSGCCANRLTPSSPPHQRSLSPSQVSGLSPLLHGCSLRQACGGGFLASSQQGALPKGRGFTWGQLWGHRSVVSSSRLRSAQSAGLGWAGTDSGSSWSLVGVGRGWRPPTTHPGALSYRLAWGSGSATALKHPMRSPAG